MKKYNDDYSDVNNDIYPSPVPVLYRPILTVPVQYIYLPLSLSLSLSGRPICRYSSPCVCINIIPAPPPPPLGQRERRPPPPRPPPTHLGGGAATYQITHSCEDAGGSEGAINSNNIPGRLLGMKQGRCRELRDFFTVIQKTVRVQHSGIEPHQRFCVYIYSWICIWVGAYICELTG